MHGVDGETVVADDHARTKNVNWGRSTEEERQRNFHVDYTRSRFYL